MKTKEKKQPNPIGMLFGSVIIPTIIATGACIIVTERFAENAFFLLHPIVNLLRTTYSLDEEISYIAVFAPGFFVLLLMRYILLHEKKHDRIYCDSARMESMLSKILGASSVLFAELAYVYVISKGLIPFWNEWINEKFPALRAELDSLAIEHLLMSETFWDKLYVYIAVYGSLYLSVFCMLIIIIVVPAVTVFYFVKYFLGRFYPVIDNKRDVILVGLSFLPALYNIITFFLFHPILVLLAPVYILAALLVIGFICSFFSGDIDIIFFFRF